MRREISLEPEPACRPSASSEQEESDFQEPETEPEPPVGEGDPYFAEDGEFEVGLEDAPSSAEGEDVESGVQDERPGTRSSRPARLEYHEPQCTICNHPEREDIDQAILHWHSPTAIADEFDLPDRRIVYRHGHALGLFRQRAEQTRHALGFFIEQAQSVVPSADAIIRAIRALSCIDDQGRWHEPRKEVVITHRYEGVPPSQRRRSSQPVAQTRNIPDATANEDDHRGFLGRRSLPAARHGLPADRHGLSADRHGFSSDNQPAPPAGVSTPEAIEPPRSQVRPYSPLACPEAAESRDRHSFTLRPPKAVEGPPTNWSRFKRANWSTRVLTKIRHKFNATNKTQKNGRHTFDISGDAKNRARTNDGS